MSRADRSFKGKYPFGSRMKRGWIASESPRKGKESIRRGGGTREPGRNLIQDPRGGMRVAVSIRRLANRFLGKEGLKGVEDGARRSLRRWRFRRGP